MAQAIGGPAAPVTDQIKLIEEAIGVGFPDHGSDLGGGDRGPCLIALASQKGGTGKSTMAMLLTVALLKRGHRVGTIDLDGQQGTLSHYIANRAALAEGTGAKLRMPRHHRLGPSLRTSRDLGAQDEDLQLRDALRDLADCSHVVLDTPGTDSHLARLGCTRADTVITPLNDSLLDIDILARIDPHKREVLGPSEYSRLIWRENDRRVACDRRPIDWIVVRNRLGHVDARNTREVTRLLQQLAERLGFRLAPGLSERVVFRELFLKGLTLLDLPSDRVPYRLGPGWIHARDEVDDLLAAIAVSGPRSRARVGGP